MQKFLGLIILLIVAGVAGVFLLDKEHIEDAGTLVPSLGNKKAEIMLVGKAGSEKIDFLQSEKIKDLLLDHGLQVNVRKAGSVEMMGETTGLDFLWPASQVNVDFFTGSGGRALATENIFNSPIVIYSWDIITNALVKNGIVEHKEGVNYIVDLPKLLALIVEYKSWKDIGLNQLYGKMIIRTTDPTKSNSGNMFAALVANTLNNGEVVTTGTIDSVLPDVKKFYARLGHMERSSAVLFNMFLQQGVGAYPLIVGYENQLVEYSLEHEEALDLLRKKVRILYPVPTIWATHPFVALTENGKKMIQVLKSPEAQELAWERHGFRSGLMGVENDPSVLEVVGLPRSIDAVMPAPSAKVMRKITANLNM
ncbi:hypothetical protein [Candidatus Electrothrix sp.]|uniref:hypothetical protein n=1 Tax=Candidatus Electrothrix sp. TaxID=2170559 RepID=UPI004055E684